MPNENKTKVCSKCGEEKILTAFAKRKDRGDANGYSKVCKECHNQYYREYYSDRLNMKKHVSRVKKNKVNYKKVLNLYKLEVGCQICGYKKCHAALEFHHLNREEKNHTISTMKSKGMSKDKLAAEIQKCVLVCANCHREIESGLVVIPDDIQSLDILEDERFLA